MQNNNRTQLKLHMFSPLSLLHLQCETCEPTITTWASTLYFGARSGGTAHITSSFQRYRLNLQTKRVTAPGTFVQYTIVKNQLRFLFKRKTFTPSAEGSPWNIGRRLCGWDPDFKAMLFYNPMKG